MMPPPPAGASHGSSHDPRTGDTRPPIAHLLCACQRADPRLALCGSDVTDTHHRTLFAPEVQSCVVCLDLGRSALVAGRCDRCPHA